MSKFEMLEAGKIALIQQTKEGRILQVAMTSNQRELLQNFLAIMGNNLNKPHNSVITYILCYV